jgi:Outer membrane protein beta-barrel domain
MRTFSLLLGVCIASGVAATQESAPIPVSEVGLNYSYVHLGPAQSATSSQNGGSAYVEYNLNRVVGLVADFGGYSNGRTLAGGSSGTFTYLFGPRFNWRKSRLVPYAQFLFGGADSRFNGSPASTTQNGFATAAGGGVDIAVTKHTAVKPIQLEYVTARPSSNSFQNNLRYSAGVVFRFGEK